MKPWKFLLRVLVSIFPQKVRGTSVAYWPKTWILSPQLHVEPLHITKLQRYFLHAAENFFTLQWGPTVHICIISWHTWPQRPTRVKAIGELNSSTPNNLHGFLHLTLTRTTSLNINAPLQQKYFTTHPPATLVKIPHVVHYKFPLRLPPPCQHKNPKQKILVSAQSPICAKFPFGSRMCKLCRLTLRSPAGVYGFPHSEPTLA